jgi:hypothetical protein
LEYGAFALAFGSSRGGRTSKLHGLTDDQGRPRVLLISAGDINGMTMVGSLIDATGGRFDRLIADKVVCEEYAFKRALVLASRRSPSA